MKRRINLLKTEKKYQQLERYFLWLRRTVIAYAVVFLIAVVALLFVIFQLQMRYQTLLKEKEAQNQYLLANKNREAQLLYLANKLTETRNILKEDVNFGPYYNVLVESLQGASQAARFEAVAIDKNDKHFEFTVGLNDYASLLNFFKYIETDNFLKFFKNITLTNFDLTQTKNSYTLTFKGEFYEIK